MGLFFGSDSLATPSYAYMHKPTFVGFVLLAIVIVAPLAALLFLFLWIIVSRAPSTTSKFSLGRSAAVVVLGDVGRSPRMCFHAQSLAEDGWRVALVGYRGTPPPPPLRRSSVRHHYLVQPFIRLIDILPRTGGLFALIAAPLKLVGQAASLFWILSTQVKPPPELIIVQTPPALPTLFVVRLVGLLLGSRLIVDWHNLGYSILQLRFKPTGPVVRIAYALEKWSGRRAFAHICVTQALKQHLQNDWHVKGPVHVLYDRPPSHYRRSTVIESHKLFSLLVPSLRPAIGSWLPSPIRGSSGGETTSSPFTLGDAQFAEWRSDRPALVVSSTSWTADEDFGMLLRAASMYEMRARELNGKASAVAERCGSPTMLESPMPDGLGFNHRLSLGWSSIESRRDKFRRPSFSADSLPKAKHLPKMLLIVTGKGEQKDEYLREIARLEREEAWEWVRIRTAWLAIEDYPILLGSADVGVSLHASSSGMDLPMKVVDMLGCGLTTCALGFPCVGELVQHGQNGLVFYSEKELAAQLESLLAQHPGPNWLASRTALMPTLFPEDISKSPPMSASSSPVLPFSAEVSRSSSPPLPPGEFGRPSSPLPMFTLLQSPSRSSFDMARESAAAGRNLPQPRDWTGNWKRVVRPLITVADLEDEQAERREQQRRPWFGLGSSQDESHVKLGTPRTSAEVERYNGTPRGGDFGAAGDLRRRRLLHEGDLSTSPESSPHRLATVRSRTSTHGDEGRGPPTTIAGTAPASAAVTTPVIRAHSRFSNMLQDPAESPRSTSEASRIPGIHISAPM